MKNSTVTHRQRAELPERVLHVLDLRQGSRTARIPAQRRQEPRVRGGRQGLRTQLRREVDY